MERAGENGASLPLQPETGQDVRLSLGPGLAVSFSGLASVKWIFEAIAVRAVLGPPLVCSVHVVKRAFEPFHCQNLLQWLPRSLALLGSQGK